MKKKIVHVDDDENWRETIKGVLKDEGLDVESFSSLNEATKAMKNADRIILDGNIDFDGDGFDCANKLHHKGKNVAVFSDDPDRQSEATQFKKSAWKSLLDWIKGD